MGEGFRTFEHTGDLGLEVWAEGPERLYALAAEALHAQIIEVPDAPGAPAGRVVIERRLALDGQDESDLLVHWLNTSLLEAELAQAVWTRAEVHVLRARRLEGTLAGPRRDRAHQVFLREIKAVSHHALELDLTPGSCSCRLILDI
jgi:SHS2 domain-containing protein